MFQRYMVIDGAFPVSFVVTESAVEIRSFPTPPFRVHIETAVRPKRLAAITALIYCKNWYLLNGVN